MRIPLPELGLDCQWKSIKGYKGLYAINAKAEIWSFKSNRILKNIKDAKYLVICLCNKGKIKKYLVHCLVAQAFLGNKPRGYEVNHKDFNKHNNNLENLEYLTIQQNREHAYINDRFPSGPNHPAYKHGRCPGRYISKLDIKRKIAKYLSQNAKSFMRIEKE